MPQRTNIAALAVLLPLALVPHSTAQAPARAVGSALPHDGPVRAAAFSPDSKHAATACADGNVRVWDVPSGKLAATLKHKHPVWSVAYSPDNDFILAGVGDEPKGMDPVGEAVLWDAAKFSAVGDPLPAKAPVLAVGFAKDGKKLLLVTLCTDGITQRWDAQTQAPDGPAADYKKLNLLVGDSKKPLHCAAISPDGGTLAVAAADPFAYLWKPAAANADDPQMLPLHKSQEVRAVAFSADGKYMAVAGSDDTGGVATMWKADGRVVGQYPSKGPNNAVAVAPDGKDERPILVGGAEKAAELVVPQSSLREGAAMPVRQEVTALAISPDGKYFLVGGTEKKAQLYQFNKRK